MKVLAIVGTQLRHQYILKSLIENFEVIGVIEYNRTLVQKPQIAYDNFSKEDIELEKKHLKNLQEKEHNYFYRDVKTLDKKSLNLLKVKDVLELNAQSTLKWVKNLDIDVMFDYGSGILSNEFLNILPEYKINLHGGLSPYFRGSATIFWALYMQQPELVGTTFHLLSQNIDGGDILQHCRPKIQLEDDSADIGCKAILKSADVLIKLLNKLKKEYMLDKVQQTGGKLFLEKDYKPSCVKVVLENFKNGMIKKYLENKQSRDSLYKFIDQIGIFSS